MYRSHLFAHEKVSLGQSIEKTWRLLSVLTSANDPKVRLKAVRTVLGCRSFLGYLYSENV